MCAYSMFKFHVTLIEYFELATLLTADYVT